MGRERQLPRDHLPWPDSKYAQAALRIEICWYTHCQPADIPASITASPDPSPCTWRKWRRHHLPCWIIEGRCSKCQWGCQYSCHSSGSMFEFACLISRTTKRWRVLILLIAQAEHPSLARRPSALQCQARSLALSTLHHRHQGVFAKCMRCGGDTGQLHVSRHSHTTEQQRQHRGPAHWVVCENAGGYLPNTF